MSFYIQGEAYLARFTVLPQDAHEGCEHGKMSLLLVMCVFVCVCVCVCMKTIYEFCSCFIQRIGNRSSD